MDWFDESRTPRRPVPLAAVLVIVLAIVGALGYEIREGLSAESLIGGEVDVDDVLDGSAARRFEAGLARNSRVVRDLRPHYKELIYSLFGEVSGAVLGKERWLFSFSIYRQARPWDDERVATHARLIHELSDFLASHGCRLCVVPLPVKATIYPEMLPDDAPTPAPHWRRIISLLEERGVWTVDPAPALDKRAFPAFYTNNTHWTFQASRAVAEAVARSMRQRFTAGLPGDEVAGLYRTEEPRRSVGDLQRGIGFAKGSALEEEFKDDYVRIRGLRAADQRKRMKGREPQAIALMGTSFSAHYGFGEFLGVAASRVIQDTSRPGLGPMPAMETLVQGLLDGTAEAPEVIVWEWPEKHLFSRAFLPRLATVCRKISDATRFGDWKKIPFPPHELLLRRLALVEGDGGEFSGTPEAKDPYLEYRFKPPLPGDGRYAIRYTVRASRRERTKVKLNLGEGLIREPLAESRLRADVPLTLTVALESAGNAPIHRVRLEPVKKATPFRLELLEFIEKP